MSRLVAGMTGAVQYAQSAAGWHALLPARLPDCTRAAHTAAINAQSKQGCYQAAMSTYRFAALVAAGGKPVACWVTGCNMGTPLPLGSDRTLNMCICLALHIYISSYHSLYAREPCQQTGWEGDACSDSFQTKFPTVCDVLLPQTVRGFV